MPWILPVSNQNFDFKWIFLFLSQTLFPVQQIRIKKFKVYNKCSKGFAMEQYYFWCPRITPGQLNCPMKLPQDNYYWIIPFWTQPLLPPPPPPPPPPGHFASMKFPSRKLAAGFLPHGQLLLNSSPLDNSLWNSPRAIAPGLLPSGLFPE